MSFNKLSESPVIRTLAKDLGIKKIDNPVEDILRFCEKKVALFVKEFPSCETLTDLLKVAAAKLDTEFFEIHSGHDLENLKSQFISKGEKIFANLATEFDDEVLGITFKLQNNEPWEKPYVSVIDCRGEKSFRSYFTKWHELAHLLIHTDQQRLQFKRTYHKSSAHNPEEAMVDIIAGKFGFYTPFIRNKAHKNSAITFESIDALCAELCPESSFQASLIGFVRAWPGTCALLHCEMALKKGEQRSLSQGSFSFISAPSPSLRATRVTLSTSAKAKSFRIHQNMRVPISSSIYDVHENGKDYEEGIENLSSWETSSGQRLQNISVFTRAKRHGNAIYALITPEFGI